MVEKKSTTKTAAKKTATKKATAAKKAPVAKKTTEAKKEEVIFLNAENAGFRAGDVYQALAAVDHALSLAEVAEAANISTEDAILGIGWLLKEGKINSSEGNKVALA